MVATGGGGCTRGAADRADAFSIGPKQPRGEAGGVVEDPATAVEAPGGPGGTVDPAEAVTVSPKRPLREACRDVGGFERRSPAPSEGMGPGDQRGDAPEWGDSQAESAVEVGESLGRRLFHEGEGSAGWEGGVEGGVEGGEAAAAVGQERDSGAAQCAGEGVSRQWPPDDEVAGSSRGKALLQNLDVRSSSSCSQAGRK